MRNAALEREADIHMQKSSLGAQRLSRCGPVVLSALGFLEIVEYPFNKFQFLLKLV